MFQVHKAHIVMLMEENLMKKEEAKFILHALKRLRKFQKSNCSIQSSMKISFLVEHLISQEAKSDFVSNMHIGRSRNDMGVTMYRMSLRRYVLRLMEHHLLLQESILQFAADHKETIMPAYTHTQPAQPTTFGHYTLAIYDTMQRDLERMKKRTNF